MCKSFVSSVKLSTPLSSLSPSSISSRTADWNHENHWRTEEKRYVLRKMVFPSSLLFSTSSGYAGCVVTMKSMSWFQINHQRRHIERIWITWPVDDCPASFIHHPLIMGSLYGPQTPSTNSPSLLCTIWHVLVPAIAASRHRDSSRVGTISERTPFLSLYRAATVPSQPAYLDSERRATFVKSSIKTKNQLTRQ
jgi:hypothetical protein